MYVRADILKCYKRLSELRLPLQSHFSSERRRFPKTNDSWKHSKSFKITGDTNSFFTCSPSGSILTIPEGQHKNLACLTAFIPWNGCFSFSNILLAMFFFFFFQVTLASLLKKSRFSVSGLCLLISVWQEKSGNTCTQLITSLWICILIHFWEKTSSQRSKWYINGLNCTLIHLFRTHEK